MQKCLIRLGWMVLSVVMGAASVLAAESELPLDVPTNVEVIHHKRFPVSGRRQLDGKTSYLYGDKFSETKGAGLSFRQFRNEVWGWEAGASYFVSSATDEARELSARGQTPSVYDPQWMLEGLAVYQPGYGKILFGSRIQYLHLGLKAGLNYARVRSVDFGNSTANVYGPQLGAFIRWPLGDRWELITSADTIWHRRPGGLDTGSGFRRLTIVTLGLSCQL